MINHVEKIWGSEDWLINTEFYCSKYLNLNSGYECSLHYHIKKDETFYILCGEVELYYLDLRKSADSKWSVKGNILQATASIDLTKIKMRVLKHKDQIRIKPYLAHKFRSRTFASKILEISTTHKDEDSYRITESRKLNPGEYKSKLT